MEHIFHVVLTLAGVSLLNLVVIFSSVRLAKVKTVAYNQILASSVLLLFTECFMMIDLITEPSSSLQLIAVFFEYWFLALTTTLIIKSVTKLYDVKEVVPTALSFSIAIFLGLLQVTATLNNNLWMKEFIFLYIIISSFGFLIYYLKKADVVLRKNMFYYQSMILILLSVVDILVIINTNAIVLERTSLLQFSPIFVGLALVMSMQSTFLMEYNHKLVSVLQQENQGLNVKVLTATKLSETDELTKLANRRKMDEMIQTLIHLSKIQHSPFSIIMIDINCFKSINDRFGHTIGDEVLKYVANKLVANTRTSDLVARYGGDEFVILLPDTTRTQIDRILKQLDLKFKETIQTDVNEAVTLSMGASCYQVGFTKQQMISIADSEMYKNKISRGSEECMVLEKRS